MSYSRTCVIVPVKALDRAKLRLSRVLPEAVRQRLVLTMLEDVLAAVAGVVSHDGVIVVTPDARVAALARSNGATVVADPAAGDLNAAVATGIAYAAARGVGQALILPADVPLSTPEELRSLVQSRGATAGWKYAGTARERASAESVNGAHPRWRIGTSPLGAPP